MYIFQKTQKILQKLLLGLFSYGRRMKDFSHPSDLVNLVLQGKLLIPPPLKNVDVIFGWPLFQKLLKICCNKKCSHMAEEFKIFPSNLLWWTLCCNEGKLLNNQQKWFLELQQQLSTTLDTLWGCINHTYSEWFLIRLSRWTLWKFFLSSQPPSEV